MGLEKKTIISAHPYSYFTVAPFSFQADPFDEFDAMIANRHGGASSDPVDDLKYPVGSAPSTSNDPLDELFPTASTSPSASSTSFTLLVDASAFGKPGKEKIVLNATTVDELKNGLGSSLDLEAAFVVQAYDTDFEEFVNLNHFSQLVDGKVRHFTFP